MPCLFNFKCFLGIDMKERFEDSTTFLFVLQGKLEFRKAQDTF